MINFQIALPDLQPKQIDDTIAGGGDLSIIGGDFTITDDGDWGVIYGKDAAWQSVVRDTLSPTGSMPQRPTWGAGVAALLFKGQTKATRDAIVALTKAHLIKNPRVRRVISVVCQPSFDSSGVNNGIVVLIQAESIDGPINGKIPVRSGQR